MQGLKIQNTYVLPGSQIYHNYSRPHIALNGKTPAEQYGIVIGGENKWKMVVEDASGKIEKL
jgi:putative transposase